MVDPNPAPTPTPTPAPARTGRGRASPLAEPVPLAGPPAPGEPAPPTGPPPTGPPPTGPGTTTVTSATAVRDDEPLLAGHFPGFPIFPGIALLECAHQTVLGSGSGPPEGSGRLLDLAAIARARFLQPVFPGDRLATTARVTTGGDGPTARVEVAAGDDPAPVATFQLAYASRAVRAVEVDIRALLPHRYPMLLVDRVTDVVPGSSLRAVKAVTVNEPCYAGLADDADQAYPPALLVESWCQAAGVLACLEQPNPDVQAGRVTLFGSITDLELPGRAYPGDVVTHTVRLTRLVSDAAVLEGESAIGDTTVMRVGGVTIALRPAGTLNRPAPGEG